MSAEHVAWSYQARGTGGGERTLSLDARIPLEEISEQVLGYDLAGFFERNSGAIKTEVERIIAELLQ